VVVVRRVDDVHDFYSRVEAYLVQDEAAHNLLLGICAQLMQTDDYREPPYLAYAEEDGRVTGVALRTPPHRLVLSQIADPATIRALAGDVHACFPELPGVLAPKPVAEAFFTHWRALAGQEARLLRAERIYCLKRVVAVTGVPGEMCRPDPGDFDLLVDWMIAFIREALNEANAREDVERMVWARMGSDERLRGLRLWKHEGRPLSFAGYGGPTPNGIRIGPVYTPPEHRGHGYASALTAALSQALLDQGRSFVFLFTDLSNPTSNHIYQAIGYQPVCDVNEYTFEEGA